MAIVHKNRATLKRLQLIVNFRGDEELPQILAELRAFLAEQNGTERMEKNGRDRKQRGGHDRGE